MKEDQPIATTEENKDNHDPNEAHQRIEFLKDQLESPQNNFCTKEFNKPTRVKRKIRKKENKRITKRKRKQAWQRFCASLESEDEDKRDRVVEKEGILLAGKGESINSINDSHLQDCNRVLREKDFEWEACQLWEFGKKIGAVGKGNDMEIINILLEMEKQEKETLNQMLNGQREETILSC